MSLADVLFCVVLLALVFLFTGEPDLWDNLHARAMQATQTTTTGVCK